METPGRALKQRLLVPSCRPRCPANRQQAVLGLTFPAFSWAAPASATPLLTPETTAPSAACSARRAELAAACNGSNQGSERWHQADSLRHTFQTATRIGDELTSQCRLTPALSLVHSLASCAAAPAVCAACLALWPASSARWDASCTREGKRGREAWGMYVGRGSS